MSKLLTWALTALGNSSSSPDGAPEGMAPSGVNNTIREIMAAGATFADQLQGFINVGIAASVSSNNLTVALKTAAGSDPSSTDPLSVIFRSTTLTSGVNVSVDYSAATSVVLPAGGTLGAANAETINIHVWAVYDGTNKDIGVSRTQNHDEGILHSTTTIGTGSDATNVIYTTTGRTNAAIKLIGRLTITQGTAVWDAAPTAIKVWDNSMLSSGISGVNIQSFTATGANTYTPKSGLKYCIVISTGAGGGGGGADTDGSSGNLAVGAGGGGGATCIGFFTASQIGASQTVTIGAGSAGGAAAGGGNASAGGDTTFGALHTAGGGSGGTGSGAGGGSSNPENSGASGGTATGGTLNISGGDGADGVALSADNAVDFASAISGDGGGSFWGSGGSRVAASQPSLSTDNDTAGRNGKAYGAGGSGAICLTSTTGAAGGAGKDGVCIVIEFT